MRQALIDKAAEQQPEHTTPAEVGEADDTGKEGEEEEPLEEDLNVD